MTEFHISEVGNSVFRQIETLQAERIYPQKRNRPFAAMPESDLQPVGPSVLMSAADHIASPTVPGMSEREGKHASEIPECIQADQSRPGAFA